MNFEKMYLEEDLFPREITSYDHAIIYREKIHDIEMVLNDIISFYRKKGIRPNIYQSISEEGYFNEIKRELSKYGFEYWTEDQKYMVLSEKNTIIPNPKIVVCRNEKIEICGGVEFEY